MSYLKFNKAELVNLEYSLKREILSTNRTGGYCNTTIVGCNTRKYHGLFILPIDNFEGKKHLLLSSLDETLIQHEHEFNLGIHCYGSVYEPRGHKYIRDFELSDFCTLSYRVGGMLFTKSLLFIHNKEQLLIKYTLVEAHSQTTLRIRPFLAFRDTHSLTRENQAARTECRLIENGCSFNMYEGFPDLNLQLNKRPDFVQCPGWYKDVVYKEEERRGFECREDLFVPGYFEFNIKKGESVIFSVSTEEVATRGLKTVFEKESSFRISRDSYQACLKLAAKQFIVNHNGLKEITAGYSWLGKGLRETLLSVSGLTIFNDGDEKAFKEIMASAMKLYSNQILHGSRQVEAALWLFWVAQQYALYSGNEKLVWTKNAKLLKDIVKSYISGERMGVELKETGMLWAKMNSVAMTWMNAYEQDGTPITERAGYQVETNALWYNALCYLIEMETKYGKDKKTVAVWSNIKNEIDHNFLNYFWVEERKHLGDYYDEKGVNCFTRPNQIFACSLPYSPISEEVMDKVLTAIKKELLTTRGIRTLSPKNPLYKGIYDGNQIQRDHAYHQGSTRVWLLSFYIDACLRLYGNVFVKSAKELVNAFEEDITIHGVGSVSELYDGDPPHNPHGAISHSVAVAGLLRSLYLIDRFEKGGKL